MFALKRKRHEPPHEPAPVAAAAPAAAEQPAPAASAQAVLLQRWISLAEMQQRVIQALTTEINQTSGFIETEADMLSQQFQRLAVNAQQQTGRVDSLMALASGLEVDGATVRIEDVARLFDGTLSEIVAKILLLSKDSMSMVYALDVLGASVKNVDECAVRINAINTTMNMLAMNARIEAERAGTAGAAFRIVADEVRELSKTTKALAVTMNAELKAITEGIANSHVTLKRVATIDMSDSIMIKYRLESFLAALVVRNARLETVVADASRESGIISDDVAGMITGIQFQDRTKQRLEHVVDTLQVIDRALAEIKASTVSELPGLLAEPGDNEWVKALLAGFTMSDVRDRFVRHILDSAPFEQVAPASDGSAAGSVELF